MKRVQIWMDVDYDSFPDHYWIQIEDEKILHYYHWDHVMLWHDTDIVNADRVVIHISGMQDN